MRRIQEIIKREERLMKEEKVILSAKDVSVEFEVRKRTLRAIRNISVDLHDGETLALVGESGSGKSVFTKVFTGMLESNGSVSTGQAIPSIFPNLCQYLHLHPSKQLSFI